MAMKRAAHKPVVKVPRKNRTGLPDWFARMSQKAKKAYVKAHPNSKITLTGSASRMTQSGGAVTGGKKYVLKTKAAGAKARVAKTSKKKPFYAGNGMWA